MNKSARIILSVLLILLGGMLAMLPLSAKFSFVEKPRTVLSQSLDAGNSFTADQVAKMVVSEDSSLQLIDLRPAEEYAVFNIPGSVNVPYGGFLDKDPEPFLSRGVRTVLYSDGDLNANAALVIARGLGYKNIYTMKGGLNEWFQSIMLSEFPKGNISPRENALFETRLRARNLCNEINSLPDSLKLARPAANRFDPKKLDGGCE
jgi:rhodanese-related sulfurtransferase